MKECLPRKISLLVYEDWFRKKYEIVEVKEHGFYTEKRNEGFVSVTGSPYAIEPNVIHKTYCLYCGMIANES